MGRFRKIKNEVTNRELVYLLNLANDFRAEKDSERLVDLPDSIKGNPHNCIIARAFNFGASVWPRDEGDGQIFFNSRKDAETYAKITNQSEMNISEGGYRGNYKAPLTKELNDIALSFDFGEYKSYETKV